MKPWISMRSAPFVVLLACGCGASSNLSESDEALTSTEAVDLAKSAITFTPTVIKLGVLDDPGTTPLYGQAVRLAVQQMNDALNLLIARTGLQHDAPPLGTSSRVRCAGRLDSPKPRTSRRSNSE